MNTIKKNTEKFTCVFNRPLFHDSYQEDIFFIKDGKKRKCNLIYIANILSAPRENFHHPEIIGTLFIDKDFINFNYFFGSDILWYNKKSKYFNYKDFAFGMGNYINYINIDPLNDPLYEKNDDSMLKIFEHLESIHKNLIFM
jgi:hypothetical protein